MELHAGDGTLISETTALVLQTVVTLIPNGTTQVPTIQSTSFNSTVQSLPTTDQILGSSTIRENTPALHPISINGPVVLTDDSDNSTPTSTPKEILITTSQHISSPGTLSSMTQHLRYPPLAEDQEVRLVRLITNEYDIKQSIDQLSDRNRWSPLTPRSLQQTYTLSSQGMCMGYMSNSADSIRESILGRKPVPNSNSDDLTYPYAYSCTNTSDTYLVPYVSSIEGSPQESRVQDRRNVLRVDGVDEDQFSGFVYYMLPISKIDLYMRVKDVRQQGYKYACLALDVCGYTVIVTQSDDTTLFYFVVSSNQLSIPHEVVHLEQICSKAMLILLDENQWLFGNVNPIKVTDSMYLVKVSDYHYGATFATNSYCTNRILKSFWGYFATQEILTNIK